MPTTSISFHDHTGTPKNPQVRVGDRYCVIEIEEYVGGNYHGHGELVLHNDPTVMLEVLEAWERQMHDAVVTLRTALWRKARDEAEEAMRDAAIYAAEEALGRPHEVIA